MYTQGLAKQQLLQLAVDMFKSAVDRTPNDWVANYEYGCVTDTLKEAATNTLRGCYYDAERLGCQLRIRVRY
jgi:hypothetical protein